MKKINRTLFNKIFYVCLITTILFAFVFYVREIENYLLFIISYLTIIIITIISYLGGLNDIEYNDIKVRITHPITGNINEIFLKDLKSVYTEFVTAAGTLIVFHHLNDSKKSFGCIGCDLDEIAEMVEFINKKIKEDDKQDE
ncbi:hypothetical protein QYS48_31320 [Marivirga arenosa]|uniref:Uncharacterized protein n=1 Tax=Marivirga arenosa TaxID=3059076 RepID=A0AA51RCQ4_9BACT|nr:hypothetical protein [Marivirga sp. ABR2-2]WMN06020.1 hypothetical protein QYS48_31320 [Marivirga sp. ABR2-2]